MRTKKGMEHPLSDVGNRPILGLNNEKILKESNKPKRTDGFIQLALDSSTVGGLV